MNSNHVFKIWNCQIFHQMRVFIRIRMPIQRCLLVLKSRVWEKRLTRAMKSGFKKVNQIYRRKKDFYSARLRKTVSVILGRANEIPIVDIQQSALISIWEMQVTSPQEEVVGKAPKLSRNHISCRSDFHQVAKKKKASSPRSEPMKIITKVGNFLFVAASKTKGKASKTGDRKKWMKVSSKK